VQDLDRLAGANRTFDIDRRRFTERDVDAVVACERRLDDFLLDLAVKRDGDLLPRVVATDID
jgi:hypothetical protein